MSLRNAWVPLAQWLALVTMTVEHACRYLLPADSPVTPWAITLGRIAFPLFAGMIAWHYCHNTRNPLRYGFRLLSIAMVATLPYVLLVSPDHLNIVFTLGISLLALVLLERIDDRLGRWLTLAALALAWLFLGNWFEYPYFGLLLVPAYVFAFRHPDNTLATLPLLMVASLINGPPFNFLVSTATAALLLLVARHPNPRLAQIPAMPRPLWLAWYPLHLGLIALASAAIAATP